MTDTAAWKNPTKEEKARLKAFADSRQLRADLTPEQKAEALRIGRIEFKSAGATRKR